MDSAVSPATAIEIGRLGGLAVLNLEGLWTRYEDPAPVYEEIAELPDEKATRRMQELYLEPITRWFGELLYQPHLRASPRIEFAEWGPLAGAVGAALLPGLVEPTN